MKKRDSRLHGPVVAAWMAFWLAAIACQGPREHALGAGAPTGGASGGTSGPGAGGAPPSADSMPDGALGPGSRGSGVGPDAGQGINGGAAGSSPPNRGGTPRPAHRLAGLGGPAPRGWGVEEVLPSLDGG